MNDLKGARRPLVISALAAQLILSGCARTPSIDIFGSFFPVWMVCIAGGVILTLVVRYLLVITSLDHEIGPRSLVYTCMAFLFSCVIWLVGFHD